MEFRKIKIEEFELKKDIENLISEEKLGTLVQSITKVTGGLSHRMYKVVTDKSIYAIKELNSGIMKRSIFKLCIFRESN